MLHPACIFAFAECLSRPACIAVLCVFTHTFTYTSQVPAQVLNHVVVSICFASGPSSFFFVFRPRSRRFPPGVHLAGSRILHSVCLSRRLLDLGTCSFSGAFEHWSRASAQNFTSAAWERGRSWSRCFSASQFCVSSVPPGSKTQVRAKSCAHARFCKVTL